MKIARILKHWFYLFPATFWLLSTFFKASSYFKTKALQDLQLPHPESLTSKEKRRLKHYFYGTTYLAVIFCALRGRPRNAREKHLFTNLAALAYFFDDLVDGFRNRDDSGILWENNPEIYGQTADERGLAIHFLSNVYKELPPENLEQFKEFMHQVFNVETAGRQQTEGDNSLKISDLQRITAEKGGNSVLLFRRVLENVLDEKERDALFQFGYLIQLCDDVFDLWFDCQSQTFTVPGLLLSHGGQAGLSTFQKLTNLGGRAFALTQLFENQVLATQKSFRGTNFSNIQKGTALAVVHFIVAVTRVCLRHYEKLENRFGALPLENRKLMVVDMEKWGNRFRAVWYLLLG